MGSRFAPLPHEYMLVSILGFFISVFWVWDISPTWGFTFVLFFIILFISSIVSMTNAGTSDEELKYMAPEVKIYKTKKL